METDMEELKKKIEKTEVEVEEVKALPVGHPERALLMTLQARLTSLQARLTALTQEKLLLLQQAQATTSVQAGGASSVSELMAKMEQVLINQESITRQVLINQESITRQVLINQESITRRLDPIVNVVSLSAPIIWGCFKPPSRPSTITDAPTRDKEKRAKQAEFFKNIRQAYGMEDNNQLKCMVLGKNLPRSALTAGHLFPRWLAGKKYDTVFGFEVDSVRNGVIWCTAIEKAWDDQMVSFFLQPGDNPAEQVYLMRVMNTDLLDVKLVDVARRVAGKNKLPKAYTKALADTKYRDLDGTARLTFPTSPDHKPYQGAFVWQGLAAERSQAEKLPANMDVKEMLQPRSPVAETIQKYFDSMSTASTVGGYILLATSEDGSEVLVGRGAKKVKHRGSYPGTSL